MARRSVIRQEHSSLTRCRNYTARASPMRHAGELRRLGSMTVRGGLALLLRQSETRFCDAATQMLKWSKRIHD
eukprot:583725-Pleurochrysis_carterae.AAC.2